MTVAARMARATRTVVAVGGLLAAGQALEAQSFRAPSTLRYGSGLLNVPVASVLPHFAITGTYSGFTASVPEFVIVDPNGDFITAGQPYEKWLSDASVTVGLFDRVEIGATIQHLAAADEGGNIMGGFGRVSLLPSSIEGFNVAVGARYTNSPTFGSRYAYDFQPNRLGYPDSRLHRDVGSEEYSANLSPYAVATGYLPLGESAEVSATVGWGSGVFGSGGDLDFHQDGATGGIFGGLGIHVGVGATNQVSIVAEHDGFDANVGAQVDLGFVRAGAFMLGMLHDGYSTFRSRKFGVMASVAFPTTRADTVITPYTVTLADTTITPRMVITADTTVVGRELTATERATLTQAVLFAFDQAILNEEVHTPLREKVVVLRDNQGVRVSIEGHADELGDANYNMGLGMRRATAVMDFLVESGIDAGRLSAISHGEEMPADASGTRDARAANRRVEFVITAETTPETVITADTTMVADTVITTREEMRADTVITPSRWSSLDQGAGAVQGEEPVDLLADLYAQLPAKPEEAQEARSTE